MKLTDDGLVLISISELMQVSFRELLMEMDEDCGDSSTNCGRICAITGHTEWLSDTTPRLTVGWDWIVEKRDQVPTTWRLGLPRTNICIIGEDSRPMEWNASLESLGKLVDATLPWHKTVGSTHSHTLSDTSSHQK